jgi:hypothetical protein
MKKKVAVQSNNKVIKEVFLNNNNDKIKKSINKSIFKKYNKNNHNKD